MYYLRKVLLLTGVLALILDTCHSAPFAFPCGNGQGACVQRSSHCDNILQHNSCRQPDRKCCDISWVTSITRNAFLKFEIEHGLAGLPGWETVG